MPSGLANRLIGEAEATPPPSSVAQEWFNYLGAEAQAVLSSGNVKHLEIEAAVLLVPDDPNAEESTEHVGTWEEANDPNVKGSWSTVHDENTPFTCYSVYARHSADRMSAESAAHLYDCQTHEEAERRANALSALLGVKVVDFSIATGKAFETYGNKFIDTLVKKALKPYIKITFLDGDKEEIYVKLEWKRNAYLQGSSTHPGLVARPTKRQLLQIGGEIGGYSGGNFAMEVINSARYEGDERSGFLHDKPEDARMTAEETPDLYYRPLKFEYCNEGEPPDEMYQ